MLFRIMLKDMNPSIQGVRRTSAWLSIAESSRTSREFRKVARQPTSAGGHPVKTRLDGRLIRRTVPCGLDLRAMLQEPSGRIERRLSAILADDVAGYSRFMHRDEEPAHAKLTALLSDAVAPANRQTRRPHPEEHRGNVAGGASACGRSGSGRDRFRARRQPASIACNQSETPLFAAGIERAALKKSWLRQPNLRSQA
jgi:hypothetical protein